MLGRDTSSEYQGTTSINGHDRDRKSVVRYTFPALCPLYGLYVFFSLLCYCRVGEFLFEFPASSLPLLLAPAPLPQI